jgi:hypothetical protein
MSYKKEHVSYILQAGTKEKGISIVAKNGKTVAECRTEFMADKVIKGLKLVAEEEKRQAAFRL